jgi:hypothetical protein
MWDLYQRPESLGELVGPRAVGISLISRAAAAPALRAYHAQPGSFSVSCSQAQATPGYATADGSSELP